MDNSVVVNIVVFSVIGEELKVFLIKDPKKDSKNWCLPCESISGNDSLDSTSLKLLEKYIRGNIRHSYLEQLYTFDNLSTERKDRRISVSYFILLPSQEFVINERNVSGSWFSIEHIPGMPKEHMVILDYALKRLRSKLEYTNVAFSLLPLEFTLSEFQGIYEIILGKKLDKRNFRKKMLFLNILKSTGKKRKLGKTRPAEMFSFRKKKLTFVNIL